MKVTDSNGDSLSPQDKVTWGGGTDVWYIDGCKVEANNPTYTLTLARRGIHVKIPDRLVTKVCTSSGTIQITEVGNLTGEPKDKDLLEKLKRLYKVEDARYTCWKQGDSDLCYSGLSGYSSKVYYNSSGLGSVVLDMNNYECNRTPTLELRKDSATSQEVLATLHLLPTTLTDIHNWLDWHLKVEIDQLVAEGVANLLRHHIDYMEGYFKGTPARPLKFIDMFKL
jgi:hypothetical protein